MHDHQDDWESYLDAALFSINTSEQSSTKISPFKMMFGGREPRFPLQADKEGEVMNMEDVLECIMKADAKKFIEHTVGAQKDLFDIADANIKKSQKQQIQQHSKSRGVARIFQGGVQFEEILLITPTF